MDAIIAHLVLITLFVCMYAVLICVELVVTSFKRAAVQLSSFRTIENSAHSGNPLSNNNDGSKSSDCVRWHRFLLELVFVFVFVIGCAMTIGFGVSLGSVLAMHGLPKWYSYLLGVSMTSVFAIAVSCRFAGLATVRTTGAAFIFIMKSWRKSITSLFVYIGRCLQKKY